MKAGDDVADALEARGGPVHEDHGVHEVGVVRGRRRADQVPARARSSLRVSQRPVHERGSVLEDVQEARSLARQARGRRRRNCEERGRRGRLIARLAETTAALARTGPRGTRHAHSSTSP